MEVRNDDDRYNLENGDIDAPPGGNIRDSIIPLPYKEASDATTSRISLVITERFVSL